MLIYNHFSKKVAPREKQGGATLIEVLVTVVVLALGLLGVASLLVRGLQANTFSNYRSVAVAKAYEVTDRLRANNAAWAAIKSKTITVPSSEPGTKCETVTTGATNGTKPAACSANDQATWDLWVWNKGLRDVLPNGRGSLSVDNVTPWSNATGSYVFEVTVNWAEKDASSDKAFVLRFEP